MRDAQADVWLASRQIELGLRAAAQRSQVPRRPSWSEPLRRRAGQVLIATGERLLPAPQRQPVRAS